MTRMFLLLLTLLFSLSGPAMGEYSDFWQSSNAARGVKPGQTMSAYPQGRVVGGRCESPRLSNPLESLKFEI